MSEPKTLNESPKITDQVLFELKTTSSTGDLITPYKLDRVIIYYLIRDYGSGNISQLDTNLADTLTATSYFKQAQVIKVFGDNANPAWLSTDTDNSVLENVSIGEFELVWTPEFAREGDYIVCWTWTPIVAGDSFSNYTHFSLAADTRATTSIPTHFTDPNKYTTLLDRYLPEHTKLTLGDKDITPEVLEKLHAAIAKGFTDLEDLANQTVDLLDANAIHDRNILHLSNLFNLYLKSGDQTLWRRQIKRAIPLFKKKGTLSGLREALEQAGIKFVGISRLWQTVSPYTWRESFFVFEDNQTDFELAKNPIDLSNFDLLYRENGSDTYTTLTASDYAVIEFDSDNVVYYLRWIGEDAGSPIALKNGDFIQVNYILNEIIDAPLEAYIQSLPLADQRDESQVSYPPKNWNVRLIEETDSMFDSICPNRHPFTDPVIFGQVRTEFPYSENIYNMEEYNGSLRDSTNPCDLDKSFLDECSCCLSSKFIIDVEIESLSDSRVEEVNDIIQEYTPFHSIPHSINYEGSITEVMAPIMEDIEILIKVKGEENTAFGQRLFTRVMEDGLTTGAIDRNELASSSTVVTETGTGTNTGIVLYTLGERFDRQGIDEDNNYLEILSGPDQGEYTISNITKSFVTINPTSPDSITFPLNESSFAFRLSNELFDGSITSITQDDFFLFSDDQSDFRLSDVQPGWKIVVSAPGGVAGTYVIEDSFPNDTVSISNWPNTSSSTGITYQLKTDADVDVGDESTSGAIEVTRRGLVDGGTDFRIKYQVKQGDYLDVSGTQYLITEFKSDDEFYIRGYTSGNVGVTSANAYRRIFDNSIGYLGVTGMTLTTSEDYESDLAISNGANELGPSLEENQFKENFLVLIDSKYYQIAEIDGTNITLSGPPLSWGLSGTEVDYSIIKFTKLPKTIGGYEFNYIDRRNGDIRTITTESSTSMSMIAMMLNSGNSEHTYNTATQQEGISVEVEWRE